MEKKGTTLPWRFWRDDPVLRLALGVFFVLAVVYALGLLPPAARAFASYRLMPVVYLGLVFGALRWRLRETPGPEVRAFWGELSFAVGVWWLAAVVWFFFPAPGFGLELMTDVLYVLYYMAMLLAVERQPHRRHRWRPVRLERRLTWATVLVVVTGFFVYFLFIPILFDKAVYDTTVPSVAFYITLDSYLALRLVYLARVTRSPRWKSVYITLAFALVASVCNDLLEGLTAVVLPDWRWDHPANVVWDLPYLLLLAAARLRHHAFPADGPEQGAARLEDNLPGPLGQTMILMIVLPLAHFVCGWLGVLGTASLPHRELAIIAWIQVTAVLAFVQYRWLDVTLDDLREQRSRSEHAVARIERDMQLVRQRRETEAIQQSGDEMFREAFHACPDVMAISRLDDGLFIEVNDGCRRLFGWPPEEWVGRSAIDLGVWAEPADRQRIAQELREKGSIRDVEAAFMHRDGHKGVALFSAQVVEIEGELYLFSVTHDVTDQKHYERTLRRRLAVLDHACAAIGAVDANGDVTYWNAAAERLLGIDRAAALGASAAGLAEGYPQLAAVLDRRAGGAKDGAGGVRWSAAGTSDVFIALVPDPPAEEGL